MVRVEHKGTEGLLSSAGVDKALWAKHLAGHSRDLLGLLEDLGSEDRFQDRTSGLVGGVERFTADEVPTPSSRGRQRSVLRKENDVAQHDAADLRIVKWSQALLAFTSDCGTQRAEGACTVRLAEDAPSVGQRHSREARVKPTADHPVVRHVSLEGEWLAGPQRAETHPARSPEVDLGEVGASGKKAVPSIVGHPHP